MAWGMAQGARTLQWIGGEPTIHAPAILECAGRRRRRLPVVWKSDFYGTPETWELLDSVVDIYRGRFQIWQ